MTPPGSLADRFIFTRAVRFAGRTATVAGERSCTYAELLARSVRVADALLADRDDLGEARVAFLVPPGGDWVAVQWGIWRAGGIAVPLAVSHPPPELAYILDDADAAVVIVDPDLADRVTAAARSRGSRLVLTDELFVSPAGALTPTRLAVSAGLSQARRAMIVYTSGTTARAKGVVSTHANIAAQIETLVEAWGWDADDRILHVLPLHHVHGIINALSCALWCGALCEFLPRFDARVVWERLGSGEISLFMAVPTIYNRLIAAWDEAGRAERDRWVRGARLLRLMVSGSAPLPVAVLERWREITGHTLLERYGMTEIGMALSNPLRGERRAGTVGTPLPGVEARLVGEGERVLGEGEAGEIEVRSAQVFLEYWRRAAETAAAFRDGWFRTGDQAIVERGYWRILGRSSIDIIKTGGYKVSALEVEELLRCHTAVRDCAVVGVPDADLGERVCAALVLRSGQAIDPAEIVAWVLERMAPYKTPRDVRIVAELPRNAMGKVTKLAIRELFH